MRRFLPLAVAGTVLVLTACGSSSGSSATTSTTAPGTAAEQRIARAGLIQESDLKSWAKVKPGASEARDLVVLGRDVPECKTFTDGNVEEQINGKSPGFQQGATIADSSVVVFENEAEAQKELDLYRDPSIVNCIQAVYLKTLKPSGVTTVTVSPVAAEGVTNGFGFLVTAEVPGANRTTTFNTGIQGVQVGRALSSINVTGTPEEIANVASKTLPNIQQRLQDAQQ